MDLNKILKNTFIYFLLIIGYIFIYIVDIEKCFFENEEIESKSKVNFIYQQF